MTRNQQLRNHATNLSGGTIFTVDGSGISPAAPQTVNVARGDTILIEMEPAFVASFTHVCAQQDDVCQCSNLVSGVSSGNHMVINHQDGYDIKMSVTVGSDYELYALKDGEPVANATNGTIHVNT